jgi:hypothetical protein
MRKFRSKKAVALAAWTVIAAVGVGIAAAAVTSTVLADTNVVRERIVRSESTGAFSSGWHTHPGIAIVQVHKGYFKIYDQTCVPTIVEAGETYIETPERAVNVVGKGHMKWTTTLILANSAPGEPDRHPADNPCD